MRYIDKKNGGQRRQKAYNYLIKKGLKPHLAAGIIGNLMQESYRHLDSTVENEIGAVGIAQWLGPRKESLKKFAKDQGASYKDFDVQLDFLHEELMNTGDSWGSKGQQAFFNAKTAEEAAAMFVEKFERSGEKPGDKGYDQRLQNAKSIYLQFNDTALYGKDENGNTVSLNPATASDEAKALSPKIKADFYQQNFNIINEKAKATPKVDPELEEVAQEVEAKANTKTQRDEFINKLLNKNAPTPEDAVAYAEAKAEQPGRDTQDPYDMDISTPANEFFNYFIPETMQKGGSVKESGKSNGKLRFVRKSLESNPDQNTKPQTLQEILGHKAGLNPNYNKETPDIRQDHRSEMERNEKVKRAEAVTEKRIPLGMMPLVYLENPTKILGDAAGAIGFDDTIFPTSKEDRTVINQKLYSPREEDDRNMWDELVIEGGKRAPAAMLNLGIGAAFAPKASMASILAETLSPVGGLSKKQITKQVNQLKSLEGQKRLAETGFDVPAVLKQLDEMPINVTNSGGSHYTSPYKSADDFMESLEDMEKGRTTTGITEGSYINMDINQMIPGRTKGLNLNGKQILAHELGHALQQNASMKKLQDVRFIDDKAYEMVQPSTIDDALGNLEVKDSVTKTLNEAMAGEPEAIMDPVLGGANYFFTSGRGHQKVGNKIIPTGVERFAFLREMRQTMKDKKYIKDIYDEISPETVSKFMKENPKDRIAAFAKNNKNNTSLLSELMNSAPAVVPVAGGLAAAAASQKKKEKKKLN